MKTTIIQFGGLGNQMFIYAFFYAMSREGHKLKLDASLYNSVKMHNGYELPYVFNITEDLVNRRGWWIVFLRLLLHFKPNFLLYRDNETYDKEVFRCLKPFVSGYFQNPFYFDKYREELLVRFAFRNITERNQEIASFMQKQNSVSLHVRRGDYLKSPSVNGLCTEDYYKEAVIYIQERVDKPYFYIFSNDTEWCKTFANNLNINYTIVKHNTGVDSFQDMFLMSQCKHNILANSSFSWWGAYLNKHINAIKIAPSIWNRTYSQEYNKTCTPGTWVRLDNFE